MTEPRHRALVRIVAPAAEPLTLSETKDFLRITHNDDDSRLGDMITASRLLAEQWMKRSLVTQSWKATFEGPLSGTLRLPMGPVISIASVASISDGASSDVSSDAYTHLVGRDAVMFDQYVSGDFVEITYSCGYGDETQTPKPIKIGMLAHIAAMVDGEITLAPIPDQVLSYYMPFRELGL